MDSTVFMSFLIIYDIKLQCDFSYTCFEAMILWIVIILGGENLSIFPMLLIVYHATLSQKIFQKFHQYIL
jgi:hypothetical protein